MSFDGSNNLHILNNQLEITQLKVIKYTRKDQAAKTKEKQYIVASQGCRNGSTYANY
jgi:hypothetical protein